MSAARWQRLVDDLAAAGVESSVLDKPYTESVYGCVHHGVSRSITMLHPVSGIISISDRQWSKNPDVWVGWQVFREGRDSIVIRTWPITKKRSDVVAHVLEAFNTEDRT
ncbi:hypothetical protein ACT17_15280 [Mycolicibacterium conceptionense]|uniref:Uncharacterized protein n=1 Tax=Mycolicibacterium conceptionense TaxID=451644 RepID=A0A0J8UB91_9MYCO|nr:hypothetical protein [Mycolicibacterium conceptionense]KMV17640.1 hypothetical protein ACT17_15280 [Mycolicibacterium conceptionense]